MHGYKSKFEYYQAGSPAGNLDKIACPVFAFHSADDWVCPEFNVPKEEIT
jgi:predicted alpha/beta-fold hydrolase